MRTLRVRGCVAHALMPHIRAEQSARTFSPRNFRFVLKRESFLPRNFSAIGIPFFYFYVTRSSTFMRVYTYTKTSLA